MFIYSRQYLVTVMNEDCIGFELIEVHISFDNLTRDMILSVVTVQ